MPCWRKLKKAPKLPTTKGSVPEAIIAFLESTDFENAIRLAVSIGGDSDTIACITGGIAEAFYKTIPEYITEMVSMILGPDLMIDTVIPFSEEYGKATSA
jgi:ADP-ribosylglycohydrolase